MEERTIFLHVCAKNQSSDATRTFISESDYEAAIDLGYFVKIIDDKEYFIPTSKKLYEHHYEVISFNCPKNGKIIVAATPFVYNAPSKKTYSIKR